MRILLVNQHYPPDSGATGRLLAQLAEGLKARGHEVSVITGRPTYEEARDAEAPAREVQGGVRIVRVPILPRREGTLGRVLHYLSFALSMFLTGCFLRRPDVVLAFSSTPMFGGVACRLLAALRRAPFVYVVQDVYPEIAEALGAVRSPRVASVARWLETRAWRGAARVVLIGDELRPIARARAVGEDRLATIPNWADVERIRPLDISRFRQEMGFSAEDFVVEYAGNFGHSQDLDTLLRAAGLVAAEQGDVQFLLVGDGSRAEFVRRAARQLPNVRVAPFQPEERLEDVLAAADLSVIPLRSGLTRFCVPSKVYSILASGRPVGAAVDADSEVARLVRDGDCGFRVDPDDAESMAREILRLARDREMARGQGRRGREAGERCGSRERALSDYENLLVSVTRGVKETAYAAVE